MFKKNKSYDEYQQREIRLGKLNNLNTSIYENFHFNWK